MTTAIWAGRLEGQADNLFREFNDSLPFDRQLVREDIEGSIAWSKALVRAGILSAGEQREIEAALGEILAAWRQDPSFIKDAEDEDVHSWV
jgi:argininosuccinate lyase